MPPYYIGTEPIQVTAETTNYPEITIGDTNPFRFYINTDESLDRTTGATLGTSSGGTLGTSTGFTLGGGTTYSTPEERYNRLKDYLNYAGYARTGETLGDVFFYETTDFQNTSVDSLVVPIVPDSSITAARGVWGVITGGSDETEIFGSVARIDMEVFVLAEYSEYDTETEVRNEFEADL